METKPYLDSSKTCFRTSACDPYDVHGDQILHQSLKSSNRPGNLFLWGNYHHISFIRAIKSGVLTMLIQRICHKGLLHLQKIVSQPFSANREPHTAIANLNIQKWYVYHRGCQGRKIQRNNFIFTRRKID